MAYKIGEILAQKKNTGNFWAIDIKPAVRFFFYSWANSLGNVPFRWKNGIFEQNRFRIHFMFRHGTTSFEEVVLNVKFSVFDRQNIKR